MYQPCILSYQIYPSIVLIRIYYGSTGTWAMFLSIVFPNCISKKAHPQFLLNCVSRMYFPTISIKCISPMFTQPYLSNVFPNYIYQMYSPLITQPYFSNVFLTVFFKCISSIYNSTITLQFISKETRGFDWHLSNAFVKFISQLYFSDVFLNCIF